MIIKNERRNKMMKTSYVVICHCYSNTGRLCEASSKGEESVKDIALNESTQNLSSELKKVLAELNKNAPNCFWAIHQVISTTESTN